jgi:elongation factor Ts
MAIDGRKVADLLTDQIAKIGEKIDLAHYEAIEGVAVSAYIHPGNRMASVVALSKEGFQEIGHNLAMQVVAMRPVALDETSVAPEVIEKELEVYRAQIREEGKPENMVENIAKGKLNKFFKENTLLSQESITEAKTSVKDFVAKADKDLKVLGFRRLELGA